jgi:hypothetical protein
MVLAVTTAAGLWNFSISPVLAICAKPGRTGESGAALLKDWWSDEYRPQQDLLVILNKN